jgi:hypothetical protein
MAARLRWNRLAIAVESQITVKHFLLQQGDIFALRDGRNPNN